jgi:hypothetical protein
VSGVDSICCLDPDLPLCFLDVLEGDAGETLLTLAFLLFGLTKQQSCKQCDQVQIEESKGRTIESMVEYAQQANIVSVVTIN